MSPKFTGRMGTHTSVYLSTATRDGARILGNGKISAGLQKAVQLCITLQIADDEFARLPEKLQTALRQLRNIAKP